MMQARTATSLLVAMVFFMENLDSTVITTALPVMARDFGVAPEHLSVGVSAYLVALTVFIPVSGWAADRIGPRRIFAAAVVLFTGASLLCALSRGLGAFTAARALQGLGGAMMVPVGRMVVLRQTPKEGIVDAIAILTWPALVAPVLGPPVGGWIATHWSWPWIFWLNLPLGVLALAATWVLIPNKGEPVGRFDGTGFVLTGLGFAAFMTGLELTNRDGVPVWLGPVVLAAGLGLLAVSVRHLLRADAPLFSLAPLRVRSFVTTAAGGSLFRIAIATAPFLLPLLFQVGLGYTAAEAGGLLLWLFAGNLLMKPFTTWVMRRFGFKSVLVGNGLLVALGFVAYAQLDTGTPRWLLAGLLFVTGMTRSMQYTALNTIGFAEIPQPQMRDATTLFSVVQQMNAGMGIAIAALLLSVARMIHGHPQAQTADYQLTFAFIAVIAALSLVDSLRLPRRAGAVVLEPRAG